MLATMHTNLNLSGKYNFTVNESMKKMTLAHHNQFARNGTSFPCEYKTISNLRVDPRHHASMVKADNSMKATDFTDMNHTIVITETQGSGLTMSSDANAI
jgi:hypothetical protein